MLDGLKHTEGVILKVISFRDYDQIVSLFTRDAGLLKVMHKNGKGGQKKDYCFPLSVAEVIYGERNSEISHCHDLTIIEFYNDLRKNLKHLETGCDLIHVIGCSQLVGNHSPALYELLRYYLNKISSLSNPELLSISFRLKLLLHEGILSIPLVCEVCRAALQNTAFLHGSEWYCSDHHLVSSVVFNEEEIQILYRLSCSQSFQAIASCTLTPMVKAKVFNLFNQLT
jgi:DNA repair protein RecO (recombination protein O)